MRRLLKPFGLALGLFASITFLQSCAERSTGLPVLRNASSTASLLASVRISEIHYDNAGADANEAVEVSGPAGTSLSGWSLVLYNGASTDRRAYQTINLTGTFAASCGSRGVLVFNTPGIQNGDPDGVALVNNSGALVEFLSYGGSFVGANGVASGVASVNLPVKETGTTPIGQSLQRTAVGDNTWIGPTASSFGTCTDQPVATTPVAAITVSPDPVTVAAGSSVALTVKAFDSNGDEIVNAPLSYTSEAPTSFGVSGLGVITGTETPGGIVRIDAPSGATKSVDVTVTEPPALPPTDIYISEFHYDNDGTDVGEAIEVSGPGGTDFTGWSLVLYNGNGGASYSTISLNTAALSSCDGRALAVVPAVGMQNGKSGSGEPDGIALVSPAGALVEFLTYEGTFRASNGAAKGYKGVDVLVEEGNQLPGRSLQKDAIGWYGPNPASFGNCNAALPPFLSLAADRASLAAGFEGQVFATYNDGRGGNSPALVTWASDTPDIATIDADGVVHAIKAGTATLRATTADDITNTASLTIFTPTRGTAVYQNNVEFGTPTDANPSDDFIISKEFYTSSFSVARGIPNWVSYNIDASTQGSFDRCNCFTYDPELPQENRYTTADYTGVGGDTPYHGYPIDRGHLLRSFDRTSGSLDNANTFYFSNIIPQAADNNQGPWANLESYLGDLASLSDKELFVVAGASGTKGTVKDEGKITIPRWTWKVALILPRDQGLANVDSWDDVEVVAVIMPNEPGIRNVEWETYKVTIDSVEALSGYDFFSLLPDQVEIAIESNTQPPVASINGPFTLVEGGSVSVSGVGSSDPDGDAITYSWNFGDGGTATGPTTTHSYTQDGNYTITLTVTDARGLIGTRTTTAIVANVPPSVTSFSGATILPGETYSATGSFSDPGADSWSATVNYGDGSGAQLLPLSGMNFSLSHTYAGPGSFTVTVGINDGTTTTTRTATVVVTSWTGGVDNLTAMIAALGLPKGTANSLQSKLAAARKQIERDHSSSPANILGAFVNEIEALINSGRLSSSDAAPLLAYAQRLSMSLSSPQ